MTVTVAGRFTRGEPKTRDAWSGPLGAPPTRSATRPQAGDGGHLARSGLGHSVRGQKACDVATTGDLVALGFTPSSVSAVTLNLPHPDPFGIGPFCRLRVQTTAPRKPGVYAWVVDGRVCYVGKAVKGFGLIQKVKGQSLGRAYDDYTYCPPSKALASSQTRARVNGLLNASLVAGNFVEWWWLVAARPDEMEDTLIQRWNPPWNIVLREH